MPRTGVTVHVGHATKEYVEHLFRESLREAQLAAKNGGRAPSEEWERAYTES